MKNTGNNTYLPITLPFNEDDPNQTENDKNTAVSSMLINESGHLIENEYFMVQFPKFMPLNKELQTKLKNEELDNEEPVYDNMGFLITKDFENVFKSLKNNSNLGKIKVYKSGKVKMQIGDNLFDLNTGIKTSFSQEFAVLAKQSKELFILGNIKDKNLIVTHEFE